MATYDVERIEHLCKKIKFGNKGRILLKRNSMTREDFFVCLYHLGLIDVSRKGIVTNLRTGNRLSGTAGGMYYGIGWSCRDRLGKYTMDILVHRFVYLIHKGPIPCGMQIDHIDNNKRNNHVSNLDLVTPAENMQRAVATGIKNSPKGERHGLSKIPDLWVPKLRRAYSKGRISVEWICKKFIVKKWVVVRMLTGETYSHLPDKLSAPLRSYGVDRSGRRLEENDVIIIRRRYAAGEEMPVLMKEYGVDRSYIRDVICGRLFKKVGYATRIRKDNNVGGKNPAAAFTDEQVIILRNKYKRGKIHIEDISRKFNVTKATATAMLTGKTYRHLPV